MIGANIKEKNLVVAIKSVETLDERVLQASGKGLASGLLYSVGVVQREFLQGPRPAKLGEVTTRLRQSISSEVAVGPEGVVGRIGTNVVYGAFHEFGFKGSIQVRAHTRFFSAFNVRGERVTPKRRPRLDKQGRVIGFRESTVAAAEREGHPFVFTQQVKAHTRNINYTGRPFVRPALEKSLPVIKAAIEKDLAALNA